MNLKTIVSVATNKDRFQTIEAYSDFCLNYLEFIKTHLQAVIVSRNENHYRFFQYKEDGTYNVTRPINSNMMLSLESFDSKRKQFLTILKNLFERFIRMIILEIGIDVTEGTIAVPVKINGTEAFKMNYQHDLIIKVDNITKAIGSVKTSSKDRIDKIFIDKFLYNRLTDTNTPHFAIFLNDVQRKGKEGKYGISATFLPGHFKGYTIKLNPLDGVYYFDIRPNMRTEDILKDHIKTFDHFLIKDVWKLTK